MEIAVVIPCYNVKAQILNVLSACGPEINSIYVIDDACPEESGKHVSLHCSDKRVHVITHDANTGVGGAVMTGYRAAIASGADIIVKIDGDGQMDPLLLPNLVAPIITGQADYVKGNRFYDLEQVKQMPRMRIIGNLLLSFMAKISTGYWSIFDPTNGFTAIDARVAARLPLHKISQGYFFETDILFRLNTLRAVVIDFPMNAVYAQEKSNLKITKVVGEFMRKHIVNCAKRIFYNYFLRDLTVASFELVFGLSLLVFGFVFGLMHWMAAIKYATLTPLGTIMIAALSIISGLQLLLAFLNYDITSTPTKVIGQFFKSGAHQWDATANIAQIFAMKK